MQDFLIVDVFNPIIGFTHLSSRLNIGRYNSIYSGLNGTWYVITDKVIYVINIDGILTSYEINFDQLDDFKFSMDSHSPNFTINIKGTLYFIFSCFNVIIYSWTPFQGLKKCTFIPVNNNKVKDVQFYDKKIVLLVGKRTIDYFYTFDTTTNIYCHYKYKPLQDNKYFKLTKDHIIYDNLLLPSKKPFICNCGIYSISYNNKLFFNNMIIDLEHDKKTILGENNIIMDIVNDIVLIQDNIDHPTKMTLWNLITNEKKTYDVDGLFGIHHDMTNLIYTTDTKLQLLFFRKN